MLIYKADLTELADAVGYRPQYLGSVSSMSAGGPVRLQSYFLQASMTDESRNPLIGWTNLQVVVKPGHADPTRERLSGIWVRHMCFQATVPNNQGVLYLTDSLQELGMQLPTADPSTALPPRMNLLPGATVGIPLPFQPEPMEF